MKILKRSITVALLLFVGATFGLLIAQEVTLSASVSVAEGPDVDTTDAHDQDVAASSSEDVRPETKPAVEVESVDLDASEPEPTCVVNAIYFHNTLRCRTCRNIEETARAVVETEFADAIAAGRVRWSAINMERQQEYVDRFDLVKPTLVLVRSVDEAEDAWVALDETWSLIRYESRFAGYVEGETRSFLEACP